MANTVQSSSKSACECLRTLLSCPESPPLLFAMVGPKFVPRRPARFRVQLVRSVSQTDHAIHHLKALLSEIILKAIQHESAKYWRRYPRQAGLGARVQRGNQSAGRDSSTRQGQGSTPPLQARVISRESPRFSHLNEYRIMQMGGILTDIFSSRDSPPLAGNTGLVPLNFFFCRHNRGSPGVSDHSIHTRRKRKVWALLSILFAVNRVNAG